MPEKTAVSVNGLQSATGSHLFKLYHHLPLWHLPPIPRAIDYYIPDAWHRFLSVELTLFRLPSFAPLVFQVCPAGYNCGSGTDRSTQFAHKCPAGLFCSAGTEPDDQYESVCDAGYYCIRGTPNYLATQVMRLKGVYTE